MLAQIIAVTGINLRAWRQRLAASLVSVIGIAGVVVILIGVLSIGEGFRRTLELAGSDRVVIVLRGGTSAELISTLTPEQIQIISGAPGIAQGAAGPIASAELYTAVDQAKRSTGTSANAPLRGIGPAGVATHERFKLTDGRMFARGRNEVIVGQAAMRSLQGLELGKTVRWGNNIWQIVGVFSDGGSVSESEIWTDASVLQSAYALGGVFQSLRVLLRSPGDITAFKDFLTSDPRLNVTVMTERQFYAEQSAILIAIMRGAGAVLGTLMGIGAMFGALNTMYTAVASRTAEIATLRALGFGGTPVLISVVVEALLLALIGGAVGAGIAYLGFDGLQTSTLNFSSFSLVSFAFRVTPALIVTAVLYALVLGLAGGLLPAIHATRQSIVAGLRAT
jgi:putative ABC transport system permease protein